MSEHAVKGADNGLLGRCEDDGPLYPDGTDAEGFPGGDERMKAGLEDTVKVEEIRTEPEVELNVQWNVQHDGVHVLMSYPGWCRDVDYVIPFDLLEVEFRKQALGVFLRNNQKANFCWPEQYEVAVAAERVSESFMQLCLEGDDRLGLKTLAERVKAWKEIKDEPRTLQSG